MPRGSCLCGAVRYETSLALEGIDHCHCSMCRRSHGAAFSTYGRVPKQALRIATGAERVRDFHSSDAVTRSFCQECGSNLFFHLESNRMLRRSIFPQRQIQGQFNCQQRRAERQQRRQRGDTDRLT